MQTAKKGPVLLPVGQFGLTLIGVTDHSEGRLDCFVVCRYVKLKLALTLLYLSDTGRKDGTSCA